MLLRRRSPRIGSLTAAVALATLLPSARLVRAQPPATFVWSGGGTTSNTDDSGNWIGNIAPAINQLLTLIFGGTNRPTPNVNQSGLSVANLTFDPSSGGFTMGGNALTLTGGGAGAALVVQSGAANRINNPLTLAETVTVSGNGVGALTLGGALSGSGGLIVDRLAPATPGATGGGLILLSDNAFSGGLTLKSGNVAVNTAGGLGAGTVTVAANNTASLRFLSDNKTYANNFVLNGDLRLTGNFGGSALGATSGVITAVFSGSFSGSGGITYTPFVSYSSGNNVSVVNPTLLFTNNSTLSGAVRVDPFYFNVYTPEFILRGSGAMRNVPSFTMIDSDLFLDNSIGGDLADRINPNVTVNLYHGSLALSASNSVDRAQSVAAVNASGNIGLVARPGTATSATLNIGTLNRTDAAGNFSTIRITAMNLGGNTILAGRPSGFITVGSDPGGAIGGGGQPGTINQSILPYVLAEVGDIAQTANRVTSFVRFDPATGNLIGLNPTTEMANSLTATTPVDANVRLSSNTVLPASGNGNGQSTVNSLLLLTPVPGSAAVVGTSITGSGTLRVTSGAVATTASNAINLPTNSTPSRIGVGTLDFGNQPGIFQLRIPLDIDSTITGTGGIVSAAAILTLNGANTFSGPVRINAGRLQISSDNALGVATNPVLLFGGQGGTLQYAPDFSVLSPARTLSRPVTIGPAGGALAFTGVGTLTVTSNLNGLLGGALFLRGPNAAFVFSGNNVLAGRVLLEGTSLVATSPGALGAGGVTEPGALVFASGFQVPATTEAIFQNDVALSLSRPLLLTPGANAVLIPRGADLTLPGGIFQQDGASTETITLRVVGSAESGGGAIVLPTPSVYAAATILGDMIGVVRPTASDHALSGGTLRLTDQGAVAASSAFTLNPGGQLVLDNAAVASPQRMGVVPVTMAGGALTLIGNPVTSLQQRLGALTLTALGNTITIAQPSSGGIGQSTVLRFASYTPGTTFPNAGGMTFFRGDNLGGSSGDYTRVIFDTAPALAASGLIQNAVGAASANGVPTDFVTYGPNGVTLFTNYVPPTSGTTNAVVDLDTVYQDFTLNPLNAAALRIRPGGSVIGNVQLSTSGGSSAATGGALLVTAGANASISGRLTFSGRGNLTTVGDLSIGTLDASAGMIKMGPGTLTVSPTQASSLLGLLQIQEGELRLNRSLNSLTNGLYLAPGARLTLAANVSASFQSLSGFGTATVPTGSSLGSGTSGFGVSSTISTAFVGAGALGFSGNHFLNGSSPNFTGTTSPGVGNTVVQTNDAIGGAAATLRIGSLNSTGTESFYLDHFVTRFSPQIISQATTTDGNVVFGVAGARTDITSNIQLDAPLSMAFLLDSDQVARVASSIPADGTDRTGLHMLSGTIGGVSSLTLGVSGATFHGVGNVRFAGDNTYTGGTQIIGDVSGGNTNLIGIASNTAFGTGTITTRGAVNFVTQSGPRSLANAFSVAVRGQTRQLSFTGETLTLTGAMDLDNGTAILSTSSLVTIAGTISNGALTKTGSDILRLTGANTYAGATTVSAGTLQVDGSIASSSGTTVQSGAILAGTGNAGAVRLNSGGYLAPGAASGPGIAGAANGVGTLSANSLTWDTDGVMLFSLGAGGVSDRLALAGFFSAGSGDATGAFPFLFVDDGLSTSFSAPTTYTLATFNNSGNASAFSGADRFRYSFRGTTQYSGFFTLTGNQLDFTVQAVIPEPSTLALLLPAGLTALALNARRRRR